jgi:hypothetical protein
MEHNRKQQPRMMIPQRRNQQGGVRIVLLVACFFLLGVGATVLWFNRSGAGDVPLSDTTKSLLATLPGPVELRFHSVLDPTNLPPSVPALSAYAERLLVAYEKAGAGKIKLTRFDSDSDAAPDAAVADGMQGFNREKGDVCYLGIAVVQDEKKEVLPRLSPEWENALEIDLTRAIARVIQPTDNIMNPAAVAVAPAIKEQLQRVVPNLESISVEDGSRQIRETALQEFQAAAREFQKQIEQAEQQLKQAQSNGSSGEQQSAMQHLQQVQAGQAAKLKEIAARAQAQVEALKQLKSAPPR